MAPVQKGTPLPPRRQLRRSLRGIETASAAPSTPSTHRRKPLTMQASVTTPIPSPSPTVLNQRKRNSGTVISASSPLKRFSYPSPVHDQDQDHDHRHRSKSSPSQARKKTVMFAQQLIHPAPDLVASEPESSPATMTTPHRSILKDSSPLKVANDVSINETSEIDDTTLYEFWSPGNIARIPETASIDLELQWFKSLLIGGLTILEMKDCDKKFEIYATFNLLLKELNDKKLLILVGFLPDLLRLCKKDLNLVESQIFKDEKSNPFLIRIDTQIVKILTILLSNIKLIQIYWKKSKDSFMMAKWCITHSCTIVSRQEVSKGLLTANLQLLKDHKLHQYLNLKTQEEILFALLNMKFYNSASLLVEKLYTLKSLITNHTSMMEKNVKSWIGFLFSAICDFDSVSFQKVQTVASLSLLEASKLFLTSKLVNFEIRAILNNPINKFLILQQESLTSGSSTQVGVSESTLNYLSDRLLEQIALDNVKSAMDIWLGVTLLLLNDTTYLRSFNLHDSKWLTIIEACFHRKDDESKFIGIKCWRVLIYILSKDIDMNNDEECDLNLALMFKIFKYKDVFPSSSNYLTALINTFMQIIYAISNNSNNHKSLGKFWNPYILQHLQTFFNTDSTSATPEKFKMGIKLFNHLLSQQPKVNRLNYYLVRVLSVDNFNLNELESFPSDTIFQNFESIFKFYLTNIFNNIQVSMKNKITVLSTVLNSLRTIMDKDLNPNDLKKMFQIIDTVSDFMPEYFNQISKLKEYEKLEYITRIIVLIRNTMGYRVFYKQLKDTDLVVLNDNSIYVEIVRISILHKVRISEVLKTIVQNTKLFQYKIFESLVYKLDNKAVFNYISNNLESKILEKNLPSSDIQAISKIIMKLNKSTGLLKNYLAFIIKHNQNLAAQLFGELKIHTWKIDDVVKVSELISSNNNYSFLSAALLKEMILMEKDAPTILELLEKLVGADQFKQLGCLKERIFYHVMDPNSTHSNQDHEELLLFFEKYLQYLQESNASYLDVFICHGLELCIAIDAHRSTSLDITRTRNVLNALVEFIETAESSIIEKSRSLFIEKEIEIQRILNQKNNIVEQVGTSKQAAGSQAADQNSSDVEDVFEDAMDHDTPSVQEKSVNNDDTITDRGAGGVTDEPRALNKKTTRKQSKNNTKSNTSINPPLIPVKSREYQFNIAERPQLEIANQSNIVNHKLPSDYISRLHANEEQAETILKLETLDSQVNDTDHSCKVANSSQMNDKLVPKDSLSEPPKALLNLKRESSIDDSQNSTESSNIGAESSPLSTSQTSVEDGELKERALNSEQITSEAKVAFGGVSNVSHDSKTAEVKEPITENFEENTCSIQSSQVIQSTDIGDGPSDQLIESQLRGSSEASNADIFYEGSDDGAIDLKNSASKDFADQTKDIGIYEYYSEDHDSEGLGLINVAEIDSSPMKYCKNSKMKSRLFTPSLNRNKFMKKSRSSVVIPESVVSDDEEDTIEEIDDNEFTKSFTSPGGSQKRSTPILDEESYRFNPKRLHLDLSSRSNPIDQVSRFFDEFNDDEISKFTNKQVYEIETQLLAFMTRVRKVTR